MAQSTMSTTLNRVLRSIANAVGWLASATAEVDERSLYDGASMSGELNFRTEEMDLGQDPGGYYEEDL